ncbi:hypothetical protein KDL44_10630 [bacterium]|nr:hypothetical protein [bacterium]
MRPKQMRKPDHNYSAPGYYFITLKTAGSRNLFGSYTNGNEILLSRIGQIAVDCWQRNDEVYQTVSNDLHRFMPNHMHALLLLEFGESTRDAGVHLSKVVTSYKGVVTKEIRRLTGNPDMQVWQRNYYERIVTTDRALRNIRSYILYNPLMIELEGKGLR